MTKKFKLQDTVTWISQASGSYTEKTGQVIEVVKAGERPQEKGLINDGKPRDHESYVIHIPTKTRKGKGKYYWPVVSKLEKSA